MVRVMQDEFEDAFAGMCAALGVVMTDVRKQQCAAWYDRYRFERVDTIRQAFHGVVSRTSKSFPSLQEFGQVVQSAKRRIESELGSTMLDCSYCENVGTIVGVDNLAYRCICEHGARYSKNFKIISRANIPPHRLAPTSGRTLPTEAASRIMRELMACVKEKCGEVRTMERIDAIRRDYEGRGVESVSCYSARSMDDALSIARRVATD